MPDGTAILTLRPPPAPTAALAGVVVVWLRCL
jgi:hypothetical protein